MRTITMIWMAAGLVAMGRPGDLDRTFAPSLRAWTAPEQVSVASDGRIWISGGFERAGNVSTGDLLCLGENGGIAGEPAPGYLDRINGFEVGTTIPVAMAPIPLEGGDFLLPGASGGWLRMREPGIVIGKAFPDRQAREIITPQFERAGKLWVIRRFADGQRRLERRNSADGTLDTGFSQASNWPGPPKCAVPGPLDTVWVLAGPDDSIITPPTQPGTPQLLRPVFQVDSAGNLTANNQPVGTLPVTGRNTRLVAGPAGSFRLEHGPEQPDYFLWPSYLSSVYQLEWYSPDGVFQRRKNFPHEWSQAFQWAEGEDGSLLATQGDGSLLRFDPSGVRDDSFQSPGRIRSVRALPGHRWLIDGLRRLNADGSGDPSWTSPQVNAPAQVRFLAALDSGRVLAGGNFATVGGLVRNRLAVFLQNGMVDPSFELDDRVLEWRSVAVSGQSIYVVTTEPVSYGNGIRSNLVKLSRNGRLDENFKPAIPGSILIADEANQVLDNASSVLALDRNEVLVATYAATEVPMRTLYRLRPDGSRDPSFRISSDFHPDSELLARANGGFVKGSVLHRRDGTVERDLNRESFTLRPLCQWLGGVLFLEIDAAQVGRLRLWMGKDWALWFRPPVITNPWDHVLAAPADGLSLYVSAALAGGTPGLHRLRISGLEDRSFQAPAFASRARQANGPWWKAEEHGKVAFEPSEHEVPVRPLALLPVSGLLWTGGGFNSVDGRPRDGLARLAR